MNEREHDKADSFNLNNHMPVFPNPLDCPSIAFKNSTGNPNGLPLPEIRFRKNLAARCIVSREKPEQIDLMLGDNLNCLILVVAVNPERDKHSILLPASRFEFKRAVVGSPDKQHMRDYRPSLNDSRRGFLFFFREKHLITFLCKQRFGLGIMPCPDGIPVIVCCFHFVRIIKDTFLPVARRGDSATCISHNRPLTKRFGSQGRAYPGAFPVVASHLRQPKWPVSGSIF